MTAHQKAVMYFSNVQSYSEKWSIQLLNQLRGGVLQIIQINLASVIVPNGKVSD